MGEESNKYIFCKKIGGQFVGGKVRGLKIFGISPAYFDDTEDQNEITHDMTTHWIRKNVERWHIHELFHGCKNYVCRCVFSSQIFTIAFA